MNQVHFPKPLIFATIAVDDTECCEVMMRFIYVMDPMCAWCHGFQPELDDFLQPQSAPAVDWIMGGLAPDNNQPMDPQLQQTIAAYWHQIEAISRARFNHEYWQVNTPYRSTYAACRAVIAAESLQANSTESMVKAIQAAYYHAAKNPSLPETLIDYATSLGLDPQQFSDAWQSPATEQRFQQHLAITQQLKVQGFPALFCVDDKHQAHPLTLGFCQTADLLQRLDQLMEQIA